MTRLATDFSPKGRPSDAIIIGGGIAGCTLAYELAARGVKVALLEQNAVAAESSGRNTGTLLSGPQKEVVELLDASVEVYAELAGGPVPFEFARIGHLLISEDEARFAQASAVAQRYREAGVEMEEVAGPELARDHPRLGFKVAGGYFVGRAWTLERWARRMPSPMRHARRGPGSRRGCASRRSFREVAKSRAS